MGTQDPQLTELEAAIRTALDKTFPADSTQRRNYRLAEWIETAQRNYSYPVPLQKVREGLIRGKERAIALLKTAIADMEEDFSPR